ncbi:hypothetical protein TrRE_jg10214, partial [Triparma retinervis]
MTLQVYPPNREGDLPRLLYKLSLTPLPPSNNVLSPVLTSLTSALTTSMHNPLTLQSPSTSLTSSPPVGTSSPSSLSSPSSSPNNNLYIVVLPEGAVVRSGVDIDSSPRITTLSKGTVVSVLRVVDRGGIKRMCLSMEGLAG